MGLFNNFMGQEEHRVFNYKPIYYDKDEEERKRKFAAVDGSLEKKDEEGKDKTYVPGSYVHGAFRDGNYATRRGAGKIPAIIGVIGVILFVVILMYIAKFYSLL